jgi:DeoR/GlpR family transcriptional regulator of sugar metabolism
VQLAPLVGHDYSYRLSAAHRSKQKTRIGNAAALLVTDKERLFLDSGTTVLRLAEALSVKIQTGKLRNIVVLTNSLTHVETLASWCKVILLGGEIRVERRDVCGSLAEKIIQMFHVDKAFFGADAVNIASGFMTTDERTSRITELVMVRADHSYVLVDSQKFDRTSFVKFAGVNEVDAVFTDDELPPETLSRYQEAGAYIRIGEEQQSM